MSAHCPDLLRRVEAIEQRHLREDEANAKANKAFAQGMMEYYESCKPTPETGPLESEIMGILRRPLEKWFGNDPS